MKNSSDGLPAIFDDCFDQTTKVYKVYLVLKDKQWHCRECEYTHVQTTQIAGGSGIQGLQRGSGKRKGMEIESGNHFCRKCEKQTRQDRWTGNFHEPIKAPSMPSGFAHKAVRLLGSRDIVEKTERPHNQLTIDHKLPMIRWNEQSNKEQVDYGNMTDDGIRDKFQLLKKSNGSVSHNLLKSRSCETCYKTGKRGTPFGVVFFYSGSQRWGPKDKDDASGCIGCGWYDFDLWRTELNKHIRKHHEQR